MSAMYRSFKRNKFTFVLLVHNASVCDLNVFIKWSVFWNITTTADLGVGGVTEIGNNTIGRWIGIRIPTLVMLNVLTCIFSIFIIRMLDFN